MRRTDRQTDGRTDGQNYDSQGRASIAASRGKKIKKWCDLSSVNESKALSIVKRRLKPMGFEMLSEWIHGLG